MGSNPRQLVSLNRRNLDRDTDAHREKTTWKGIERRQPFTSQRERSETDPSLTTLRRNPCYWNLDIRLLAFQNCWDSKLPMFKPLSLWHFVKVVLTNYYSPQPSTYSLSDKSLYSFNTLALNLYLHFFPQIDYDFSFLCTGNFIPSLFMLF